MKRIGVIANCQKPTAKSVIERLLKSTRDMGASLVTCDDTADQVPDIERVGEAEMVDQVDVLIAMGGDGTMLRAVRLLAGKETPVLGVNIGSLGFMTSVPEDELEHAMDVLEKGEYTISDRTLAACAAMHGDKVLGEYTALNDIALGWGESSRVVTLGVSIDGENVTSYVCDGLLISTPTGSTGHVLSAGGPILHPDTCAFVLCPICPHTLSNRPLVMPDRSEIGVKILESPKHLYLVVDGQGHHQLSEGDRIEVRKSEHTARLILLPGYSYYSLLRQKLHWRGSNL